MGAVCSNVTRNTIIQEIESAVISGVCGSFAAFPDNGVAQLFMQPESRGGCTSDFIRGIFFGGADDTSYVITEMGVKVFITSLLPTLPDNTEHIALASGFNAADGAVVLALATILIQTGFITLSVKRTVEACEPFSCLPQLGNGPCVELSSSACPANDSEVANSNCTCPLFVHVNNGGPGQPRFKLINPLVVNNTAKLGAEASFSAIQNMEGNCFTALDLAAIFGGGAGDCIDNTTCLSSKVADAYGIVEQVDLQLNGLACVTIC